MVRHDEPTRRRIVELRSQGYTYTEISALLGQHIPKGTLSYICRGIILDERQRNRIILLRRELLVKAQQQAVIANKAIFDKKIIDYRTANQQINQYMQDRRAQLIALAMLYLGEGAKWNKHRGLQLGSANAQILQLYMSLLQSCYGIALDKFKCRIQHRADQNPAELLNYWSKITGVKSENFYPPYMDKRTVGHISRKKDYKGVCVVSCAGTHIQLELEQIAGIIFEARGRSSVD